MKNTVDWQTYNGSKLRQGSFYELQLDALHELFKEAHEDGSGIDCDRFLARIESSSVLVGTNHSGIAAMGVYSYHPCISGSSMRLDALTVAEEYRRQGIGSLALANVINEAIGLSCKNVRLQSRENAVAFYKANGFSYEYEESKGLYTPMRLNLSRIDSFKETTLRTLENSV